jgi:hypothetical protein
MSVQDKVNQLKAQVDALQRQPFDAFLSAPGNYPPWDGYSLEDFRGALQYARDLIQQGFAKSVFNKLPVAALNSLINNVANVVSHLGTLFANPGNSTHFQNASNQLDSLVNTLLLYDLPTLVAGGANLDKMRAFYESEAQRLAELKNTATDLNASIKNLIEPAVSGSLSKSFSDRRKSLYVGRLLWLGVTVATFAVGIFLTIDFVEGIRALLESGVASKEHSLFWPTVLLRSVVLVPIYVGFGFAFSQYKKERDLEEEYAHKAAVAATLPNYGDLAKDVAVKDQIVSGATNVIFTSPISKVQDFDKAAMPLEDLKGLIDTVGKAIRR